MRPRQETFRRLIGGRARRVASVATASALVAATCAGCGAGGAEAQAAAAPAAAAADVSGDTFPDPDNAMKANAAPVCKWSPCTFPSTALPAFAVAGTVHIPVGKYPSAVAVNPKTNKIYVANSKSNDVTVLDGSTNKTTTVKVGRDPTGVVVNPLTNKIYVSNQNLDPSGLNANENSSVTVIDGNTNKTTTVPVQIQPGNMAVNGKTNKIYVVNNGTNSLSVIDGKTNKNLKNILFRPDGHAALESGVMSPFEVQVNEATNEIYVTGPQSNTVAVVDGNTNKFKVLSTGQTPTGASLNPNTNQIYVTDMTDNAITVIDGATNKTSTIKMDDVQDPLVVKVNRTTNKIYVANMTSRSITVIDGTTRQVTTFGDLAGKPHDIAINEKTNKVYFPLFTIYRGRDVGDDKYITGLVEVLDGNTNTLTAMIAGTTPYAIAVNPETNKVYCVDQDSNTVTVISD